MKTTLFLIFSLFILSCGDNNSSTSNIDPCSPNQCAKSLIPHKTVCKKTSDTDFECVCEQGYTDNNGSCKAIEITPCSPNPCINNAVAHKTICTVVDTDFQCNCEQGYYQNEAGNCLKEPTCDANSCTEAHKTICNIENHKIICSCDSGFNQNEQGTCEKEQLSQGCMMPRYEIIFQDNLKDMALIQKLHTITGENYYSLGYSSARNELYHNIDNIDGENQCVYTGRWHNAGSGVNCEHTWPQSQFGRGEPMKSDLHHLFPTESRVNSARTHLRFGNIVDHVDDYKDYDDYGQCDKDKPDYYCSKRLLNGGDDGIFEPAGQHKGNVARAIFYFAIRYGNMSGKINDITAPFINNDMKMALIAWNKLDTVDDQERLRNDKIEGWIFNEDGTTTFSKLQGNRNPFIDCPELLDRIDLEHINFPESYEDNNGQ